MTVPVLTLMGIDNIDKKKMCFYIPKIHQQDPPQPLDNSVYIEQYPEITVFVYRFGGSVSALAMSTTI